MKVVELKSKSTYVGERCEHCHRRVNAGQWVIIHVDPSISPSKTYVTHNVCMAALVAKAGVDLDVKRDSARAEWERRRQAIIDTGDINVA